MKKSYLLWNKESSPNRSFTRISNHQSLKHGTDLFGKRTTWLIGKVLYVQLFIH